MPTYRMQADVISLVNRNAFGVFVNEGDIVRVMLAEDDSAMLTAMPAIKFDEDDYELYVPEDDFDKLLAWKPAS